MHGRWWGLMNPSGSGLTQAWTRTNAAVSIEATLNIEQVKRVMEAMVERLVDDEDATGEKLHPIDKLEFTCLETRSSTWPW